MTRSAHAHERQITVQNGGAERLMLNCEYRLMVRASDELAATEEARRLADDLREPTGVLAADRRKANEQTMDLGSQCARPVPHGRPVDHP
jgi:hypothetical protein